jgi:predicted aspartyl protease
VPAIVLPLGFESGDVYATGRIAGTVLRLIVDTGATYSFLSSDVAQAASLPIADDFYETRDFRLGDIAIGPFDFVTVDLHIPGVDALLGYNFFKDHVVCFDGPRSKLTIVR